MCVFEYIHFFEDRLENLVSKLLEHSVQNLGGNAWVKLKLQELYLLT